MGPDEIDAAFVYFTLGLWLHEFSLQRLPATSLLVLPSREETVQRFVMKKIGGRNSRWFKVGTNGMEKKTVSALIPWMTGQWTFSKVVNIAPTEDFE